MCQLSATDHDRNRIAKYPLGIKICIVIFYDNNNDNINSIVFYLFFSLSKVWMCTTAKACEILLMFCYLY